MVGRVCMIWTGGSRWLGGQGSWSDIWQGGVQVASQGLDHNSSVLARTVRWPHD